MLCETATREGKKCLSSELHGMSRMLGSVSTTIKIGDYHSPEIDKVDLLFGLDSDETRSNLHLVDGEALTFGGVKGAKTVDCEAPSPNIFVFGLLCRRLSLNQETAKDLIKKFGKRLEANIKSFEMGYNYET
jgi:Pyruvate/2-oxoacid:ferredoxin oxidoreductase gamma subunit